MEETSGTPVVGESIRRVDGVDKVRGAALYVDDLVMPGMLHGATVRSTVAHGILRAIERDPDFDWSDVTVVTAADVPGRNTIYCIEEDQPVLVPLGGHIRHVDEAIALVAAPSRRKAMQAARHLRAVVDELEAVFDVDEALTGRVALRGDDNVYKTFELGRGGDVDAALARCDLVIEGRYYTSAQEQMYIEPQGMLAHWQDGRCHIVGSLQCPYYVHKAMVPLLGLDGDDIIIEQAVTGGGFGGKEEYPSMIAGHAALLSRVAGAPVKIVYERDEDIAATTKRHPAVIEHRLGVMRDGSIVAADIDVVLDGGAYLTLSPVVLSRAVLHAAGPYKIPCSRIRGRAVATNHPPHGAFRGFGAPQVTFAYERQIDKAARALGIEPFAMRRHNMLQLGDETSTSQTLTYSVGSEAVLGAVENLATAQPLGDRRRAGRGASAEVARGRGLAFYFHGAGFTGSGEQRLAGRATVAMRADGHFEVRASSTDIGQGTLTIFSQIAAAGLGVGLDRVHIADRSTGVVPDSGPTVASRTCMVVGGVVERASQTLRRRIESWGREHGMATASVAEVARALGAAEGEISETGQYQPPPGIAWDDDTYTGAAYPVYGWAACLVDVAVDLDTCEIQIERCVHAIDVGKAIHPIIVKGQIEGGTLQALGWAVWENVVYQRGKVANDRMQSCIVPTFADAPEMETILIEDPYPFGPHGAKGVGEIPMDGPAAAVANAVEDALGLPFDRLPVSPESIEAALRAHGVTR